MRPVAAACAIFCLALTPEGGGPSVVSVALVATASSTASAPPLTSSATATSTSTSTSATATSSTATSSTSTSVVFPFPSARHFERGICSAIAPGGEFPGNFLAARDLTTSFVDGDDLLALVNRSPYGTLAADYAPSDLVQVFTLRPVSAVECETRTGPCLRREAATQVKEMLAAMRAKGFIGRVESAYRGYQSQCGTFFNWAKKETSEFCSAVDQSALAGHSQHQLGTTIDLFTEEWVQEGKDKNTGTFRNGFGCSYAGRWIEDNAWRFGFVIPYPLHPDDRQDAQPCAQRWDWPVPANPHTGYKNEAWHLRFIGVESASQYHDDWLASLPGTPGEITLEQWLRRRLGRVGDADLPVCDGCSCEACATLAGGEKKARPCGDNSVLWLDENGRPVAANEEPRILDVRTLPTKVDGAILIEVKVLLPPRTITQPPVMRAEGVAAYTGGQTFDALVPYKKTKPHRYDDLPGAWRLGVEAASETAARWPWRASLARESLARIYNRANMILPAASGDVWIRLVVSPPAGAASLRVTLLRDGAEHGTREVPLAR